MYIQYLIILKLFLLITIVDSEENIHIINIKTGQTKHTIRKGQTETIQFTAIDDGYYLITFDTYGLLIEATGDIHQDTVINNTESWRTSAYVQKFKKGDYFKMTYPYKPNSISTEHLFKIEKIDSYIDIRLLTFYQTGYFENIYLTDCQKPTYIIIKNPFVIDNTNNNLFYTKSIVHSGEFYGSYLITDYSPKNNGTLFNLSKEINLTELTILPNNFDFNVIEIKCSIPGILTFLFNGAYSEESSSSFTMNSLEKPGIVQNRFNLSHELYLSPYYIGTYYLEVFIIHGCAKFYMASLGGGTYECTNFYLSTTFTTEGQVKKFSINVMNPQLWFISKFHGSNDDGFILEKERKEYSFSSGGMRMVIPINSKKKSIKIKSSIPKFFWSLEFTQKNISYLPAPSGSSINYVYGDYVYIRNPYSFTKNKITNYNWYIIVYHYNSSIINKISYEYTNKENENDKEDDSKSFAQSPIFWVIIIILIIIIACAIGIFIYLKFIKKPNPSKDNLLNDKELNKMYDM